MTARQCQGRSLGRTAALASTAIAVAYGGYVARTWLCYGHPAAAPADQGDALLDHFMPTYDVVDRHRIQIRSSADEVLRAAETLELSRIPLVRAIFAARDVLLGGTAAVRPRPRGLLDDMRSLGWGVLAEMPGREIVMGAVTQPWQADVTFRSVPPDSFATFSEPGFVKIAWTLRADPIDGATSIFRTETRALATDSYARDRFRVYWALLSPGIHVIRRASLRPIKKEAEHAFALRMARLADREDIGNLQAADC